VSDPDRWFAANVRAPLIIVPHSNQRVYVERYVFRKRWQRARHGRIGPHLRRALRPLPGIAITSIPFHLR
jgi:hypothetical protein